MSETIRLYGFVTPKIFNIKCDLEIEIQRIGKFLNERRSELEERFKWLFELEGLGYPSFVQGQSGDLLYSERLQNFLKKCNHSYYQKQMFLYDCVEILSFIEKYGWVTPDRYHVLKSLLSKIFDNGRDHEILCQLFEPEDWDGIPYHEVMIDGELVWVRVNKK